jgi:BirA family biotin operon repressor/biotin-[acetyl-CoA-carboxylase] ligase
MDAPFDLARLRDESFIQDVAYRHETASTNTLALELVRDPQRGVPLLVLATRQSRGRGRGAHTWWSAAGALTFSLALDTSGTASACGGSSALALLTGLAVCQATQELAAGADARLKWPNDVLLGRRKLCGILAEVPAAPADRMVIGVGINVNNPAAAAPVPLRESVISLADTAGQRFDLTEVLLAVLRRCDMLYAQHRQGSLPLSQACAPWCALTGRRVGLRMGNQEVTGVCRGIDDDGALVVSDGGRRRCLSGVIQWVDWGD